MQSLTVLFSLLLFVFQSLYTLVFWLTLRMFMQEHCRRHRVSSQEDMAAEQISASPDIRGKTEIL
jgi:hypothetical protein